MGKTTGTTAAPFQMKRLGIIMQPQPGNPNEVWGTLNPGGARGPDGAYYLFPRLVAQGNYSRIGRARVMFDTVGRPVGVERLGIALEPREPYEVNRMGGHAVHARVGHAFMNEAMHAHDAIFGAEHSGHFYFRDFWDADSGLIALMNALEVIAEEGQPVSTLSASLCPRVRSGEINSEVADIPATFARVKKAFPDGQLDELDGVTITYPDWWLSVRPSNTEPLLRLNVEADTRALMEQKRDAVLQVIRQRAGDR